ncbi:MAG: GspE/PulE family protein [Terrimicrobiaceae bacterium]
MKREWLSRLSLALIFVGANPLSAVEVVFQDGKLSRDVTVVRETESQIVLMMPEGMIYFPRSAIRTIDGRPVAPLPAASQPPAATVFPAAAAPVTRTGEAVAPPPRDATPENAAASVRPPETSSAPSASPSPAPGENVEPPVKMVLSSPGEHAWNFELVLLGLLLFGGVWMRCLQWVEKDLYERRSDPRFWSLAALLLPGIGALAYAVSVRVSALLQRRRTAGPPGAQEPTAEEPAKPSWFLPDADPADFVARKGQTRKGFEFLDTDRKSVVFKKDGDLVSGLDHASEMLEEALLEHASDVHIEPSAQDFRIRFRLDGVMRERMSYDIVDGRRLMTSLKTLAEIDVAEKRKAQDGRFRARIGDREVDFRVATANSIHGEKMVIRVLDHQHGVFDLTALGMSDEMLAVFQNVIHSRNGMILATGPTGSGKTSTLYAALRQLDAARLNIMTIEDPAEYELAGATQIAVNPKAGITYASGLRSILRQDPDVIMVGEMRDAEAAQVALTAALTGHLVLSSLHTKDAVSTISRLQDMGIERYQVASALLMVLAQRLVRVLCEHCRKPYETKGDELESIGISFDPGGTIYASAGCDRCLGTGFQGRTGVFELLVFDPDIQRAVGEGIGEPALAAMAGERGFRSYRQDGALKVLLGITTVEEILQAV